MSLQPMTDCHSLHHQLRGKKERAAIPGSGRGILGSRQTVGRGRLSSESGEATGARRSRLSTVGFWN